MSYTILYRTLFVKVSNKQFIPLYESGSNNCYDWNNRRERSWSHYLPDNLRKDHDSLPFYTENELVDMMAAHAPESEYYGTRVSGKPNTSQQDFINYWRRGIKRAKTFEEIEAADIYIEVRDSNWFDSDKPHFSKTVHNEDELVVAWFECLAKCGNAECRPCCGVSEWEYKKLYPSKPKVVKPHVTGFVVKFGNNFVNKMSAHRLWHNTYLEYAKKYTSRSTAARVVERIKKGWSNNITEEVKVVAVRKNAETGCWEYSA